MRSVGTRGVCLSPNVRRTVAQQGPTLWRFLEQQAEAHLDRPLLRYRDSALTYADVHERSLRAGGAFESVGVGAGDRVCLMLGNSPDYVHAWFGLARIGAVKVPLNVHLRGEGLAYVIRHSEARVVLVEAELLPRIREVLGQVPAVERVVVRGEVTTDAEMAWSELLSAGSLSREAGADPMDTTAILYTSGTTGPPKGAELSHHAYLNSARHFAREMVGATADDVLYTSLPLFHINAQAHTVLPAMLQGAAAALGERFSASGFWDEIRAHRATIFNSLAAMIPILLKQPEQARDRDHGARLTACAATPKDLWQAFEERFGVRIVEGYGLTETAGFCVANPRGAGRIGSIGKPMDFVETRVVGEDDRDVPAGVQGEILVRGRAPHVLMEGYYRMPEETAQAMRGGWFHSGDRGYADEDGYLYFVDRMKQSIRRRGENISSWEVEGVVNAHPAVLESAAVGVPSELGEEEVKVCLVLRPGAGLDPLELVRWCETRMAYFMVPRYVEIMAELPKTATERVEKYKLKERGVGRAWDREAAGHVVRRD